MPSYDLYRLNDRDEVLSHTNFPKLDDDVAIRTVQAIALLGGKVVIWRDGVRIGTLNYTYTYSAPLPDRLGSFDAFRGARPRRRPLRNGNDTSATGR